MIIESIIISSDLSGLINFAPFGIKKKDDLIFISPYFPSKTLENLQINKYASVNYTDQATVFVDCLLGKKKFKTNQCKKNNSFFLQDSLSHDEVEVVEYIHDEVRPTFRCKILNSSINNRFKGINRANNSIIEACILASRVKLLEKEKIFNELKYLSIAVEKTSGEKELQAWNKINEYIKKNI